MIQWFIDKAWGTEATHLWTREVQLPSCSVDARYPLVVKYYDLIGWVLMALRWTWVWKKSSSELPNGFLLSHRLVQEKHNKIYYITSVFHPEKVSGRDATITQCFFSQCVVSEEHSVVWIFKFNNLTATTSKSCDTFSRQAQSCRTCRALNGGEIPTERCVVGVLLVKNSGPYENSHGLFRLVPGRYILSDFWLEVQDSISCHWYHGDPILSRWFSWFSDLPFP